MSGWNLEPCGNLDSCTEDDVHPYPIEGTVVRVPVEADMQVIGEDNAHVTVEPGDYTVIHVLHVAHQAALDVGDGLTVWADVEDDIEEIV